MFSTLFLDEKKNPAIKNEKHPNYVILQNVYESGNYFLEFSLRYPTTTLVKRRNIEIDKISADIFNDGKFRSTLRKILGETVFASLQPLRWTNAVQVIIRGP